MVSVVLVLFRRVPSLRVALATAACLVSKAHVLAPLQLDLHLQRLNKYSQLTTMVNSYLGCSSSVELSRAPGSRCSPEGWRELGQSPGPC